ncbi:MAG: transporter substrate-binding protein, partial [Desulfobacterales bacterium]|nr:transporter substrate-binding protein [Desulfobacterales bacterium]
FKAPSGFTVKMDEKNHHLHKPVFIGAIQPDAQFRLVWKLASPLKAAPWNYYLPGNEAKMDEPRDRK